MPTPPAALRRDWLRASLGATAWAAGRATFARVLGGALGLGSLPTAQAQGMLSGKLLSLSEMLTPSWQARLWCALGCTLKP